MKRVLALNTVQQVGQKVLLKGWVKTVRRHGKLIFLDIRDRSGVVQVVVNPQVSENAYEAAEKLHPEFVVQILGEVKKRPSNTINPDLPTGEVEIEATDVTVLSSAQTLPFDMGTEMLQLELPTLFDHRSLTLRHPSVISIFQVQAAVIEGFRKAAERLDCTEIVVPTLAGSATEGGAEVFAVDYFGHKVYLTQSPQLYKQMMVPIFERVWTIAHAYRAEPSVTTRHLTETTQMDCELGFVTFEELLNVFEEIAVSIVEHVERSCKDILTKYELTKVGVKTIPRLRLREAQEIIFREYGRDVRAEKDLSPQDEVDICKWAKEKQGSDFVTITHFPTNAKPFYTMPDPDDPSFSLSYDLLFRGLEILSGSQRIHDYHQLVKSLKDRGMNPSSFELYLQAFKYGMPPEGGFSFGLERFTMKLLNLENVRQASLFPRDMERVDERFSLVQKKAQPRQT